MLERTSTSLEPVKLQCIAKAALQAQAKKTGLRPGFWQHGASALELHQDCARKRPSSSRSAKRKPVRPLTSDLRASAFRLDFLYPNHDVNSLRRAWVRATRQSGRTEHTRSSGRLYGSSSQAAQTRDDAFDGAHHNGSNNHRYSAEMDTPDADQNDSVVPRWLQSEELTEGSEQVGQKKKKKKKKKEGLQGAQINDGKPKTRFSNLQKDSTAPKLEKPLVSGDEFMAKMLEMSNEAATPTTPVGLQASTKARFVEGGKSKKIPEPNGSRMTGEQFMAKMLAPSAVETKPTQSTAATLTSQHSTSLADTYSDVYHGFLRLDEEGRHLMRPAMTVYLSQSFSRVHNDRAKLLFEHIPIQDWTDQLLHAAVVVFLRTGDRVKIVKHFERAASERGLQGGLELLMADSLVAKDWPSAVATWRAYYAAHSDKFTWFRQDTLDAYQWQEGLLDALASLDDMGSIYLAFDKYLGSKVLARTPDYGKDQNDGLFLLRRRLAKHAIQQPCPSPQAKLILGQWRLNKWYSLYFARFRRNMDGNEAKLNILRLPGVYHDWRELPDFEPSAQSLYLMIRAYFPDDAAGMDELRRDWIRTKGELSAPGFRKFLQFYSHIGDLHAVHELWGNNFHKHKDDTNRPAFFQALINVHAQVANPEGARDTINNLMRDYGFRPDVEAWNLVLKAYVRSDDLPGAVGCLHDIKASCTPNSDTYAYIMSLCARLGALHLVHQYFAEVRSADITVSPEVARQLVEAYATNKQFHDGEILATELDSLGVKSPAVWNPLIHGYGLEARISDCYAIVSKMTNLGVQPDTQTYERLLMALAKAGRTTQAYQVLMVLGEREKLFRASAMHYTMVLMAAARADDFPMVVRLARHWLRTHQTELPFDAHVARLKAAVDKAPSSDYTKDIGVSLINVLVKQVHHQGARAAGASIDEVAPLAQMDNVSLKTQYRWAGLAVELLLKMNDHATLAEVTRLYLDLFPGPKRTDALPPKMLGSLLQGFSDEGQHDKVVRFFNAFRDANLPLYVDPAKGIVYPSNAYQFSRLIEPMSSSLAALEDGDQLLDIVTQLVDMGFRFTTANWDKMLRKLVDLGHWESAMQFCENHLMRNWLGWPLWSGSQWPPTEPHMWLRKLKQRGHDIDASRPKVGLVAALQQEYLKLQGLAPWSTEMARKAYALDKACPRLMLAFKNSKWNSEKWIAQGGSKDPKAFDVVLKSLSPAKLRQMWKLLKKDLDYHKLRRKQLMEAHADPFEYKDAAERAEAEAEAKEAAKQEHAAKISKTNTQRAKIVASRFGGLTEEEVEQIRDAVRRNWEKSLRREELTGNP